MSMAGFTTAAIIGSIAAAGASTAGTVIASKANNKAAKTQQASNSEAIAFEREKETQRRKEFDATEAENRRRWDVESAREESRYGEAQSRANRAEAFDQTRYANDEKRKEPYRQVGRGALAQLGTMAGVQFRPSDPPQLPPGWTPGQMAPPTSVTPFQPPATLADLGRK
jgi:hypothetical protein